MNELLSILQLIIILGIFGYEIRLKSSASFLWGTLTVLFAIPHFLSTIWRNQNFSEEVLTKAGLYVIVFCIVYIFTRIIFSSLSFKSEIMNSNTTVNILSDLINDKNLNVQRFMKTLFAIFVLSNLLLIIHTISHFGSLSGASWLGYYNLNKEQGVFNLYRFSQFLYFASSPILFMYLVRGKRTISIIMILLILFYVWLTGNRITVLPLLVSLLTYVILKSENKKKYLLFGGIVGIISIYLIYFLRLIRLYGSGVGLFNELSIFEINDLVISMLLNGDGELGLRNAFYYFITYNNDFPGFGEGNTYKRLFFILIPGFLIGGIKPPDFAITMGQAWMNNYSNDNFSMHPTLFGDSYANFGFAGVFVGFLCAFFVILMDKLILNSKKYISGVLYVSIGIMYVVIGRGSIYNAIFSFIVTLVILSAVLIFNKIRLIKY